MKSDKTVRSRTGTILIVIGALMLAAAAWLVLSHLNEARTAGESAAKAAEEVMKVIAERQQASADAEGGDPAAAPDQSLIQTQQELPVQRIETETYCGLLSISDLGLNLPVINTWSYENLRVAPCRYAGTPYRGDMVLLAHNYDRHFGRLGQLRPGARLTFADMDGNLFEYEAADILTVSPEQMDQIVDTGYPLTLFTCTPGGSARLVVRCSAVGDRPALSE